MDVDLWLQQQVEDIVRFVVVNGHVKRLGHLLTQTQKFGMGLANVCYSVEAAFAKT